MTPQEANAAAGVLSNKILDLITHHDVPNGGDVQVDLQVTYIALMQLIASFSMTMGFEEEALLHDMKLMLEQFRKVPSVTQMPRA